MPTWILPILTAAGSVVMSTLASMAAKLMTQNMVQWVMLELAKSWVTRTDTPEDDKFLAKIIEELNK